MEPWYSGAVVDAVREAKTRRGVLIVYAYDDSDQSRLVDQLWSTVWTKVTDTTKIVALRLKKDTEACSQFMVIYKVENYPTIYFIDGRNGKSLTMMDHNLDNADQIERVLRESLSIVDPSTTANADIVQSPNTVEEKVIDRLTSIHGLLLFSP
jgi:hypothetical protein